MTKNMTFLQEMLFISQYAIESYIPCLNVKSRAIYQNKYSYFFGITPALVFTTRTAAGYLQGFQSR